MFARVTPAKKRCTLSTSRWSPVSSEHSAVSLSDVTLPEDPWLHVTRDSELHTPPAMPYTPKPVDYSVSSEWSYRGENSVTRRSPIYTIPEDARRLTETSSPPPLPPRRNIATQTANTLDATTYVHTHESRVENSRLTNCQQTVFASNNDIIINELADYSVCLNGDTAIHRVVRIRGDFEIAPLSGRFVATQILYPTQPTRCECCTSLSSNDDIYECMCRSERVYSSITRLADSHWLAEVSRDVLRVKEGVVSRFFAGRLNLCVFNNTDHSVKILSGSPIAFHVTRAIPYHSQLDNAN